MAPANEDEESEPDLVSIEAFGHNFRNILTGLAEDLRTLEREGAIYWRSPNYGDDGEFAGTFTRVRVKLRPKEIVEYVEAHIAMQQFDDEFERTNDFAAAVLGIANEKFRRRVVEYHEYGTRHRDEYGDPEEYERLFRKLLLVRT